MDSRLPDRFWDKVEPCPMSGCWNWSASTNKDGYGQFRWQGKIELAHRLAYRTLVSELSSKETCDHLCRNRSCVNPSHIDPVPHIENVRRGEAGKHFSERTHCKNGHRLSGENLAVRSDRRGRGCRECMRKYSREHKRRSRAVKSHE